MGVLKRIQWGYFVLSILMGPVILLVSCLKWRLILEHGKKYVAIKRLLQIYCIGYFFSNILPSTVGGDVVRSFYGGNEVGDQVYSAISVFIERFSGIVFLFLLVLLIPLLQPEFYYEPPVLISAVGGFVGLAMVFSLVLIPSITIRIVQLSDWLAGMVIQWITSLKLPMMTGVATRLERVVQTVAAKTEKVRHRLKQAWQTMSKDRNFLFRLIVLTLLFYLFAVCNVFLSFKAFGVHVDFLTVTVLVPAALFFAHLPVTILGNLGYFESVFVVFFMIAGVPPVEALAMGLLLRLKMFLLGVVGMFFYFTFVTGGKEKSEDLNNYLRNTAGL